MPSSAKASAATDRTDHVVRRAQQGDVEAFEEIYYATAPAVYRLCRRMSRNDREATELMQDVFVRAWERLVTFEGRSSLATWLHRLTVNLALERLRASRRDSARLLRGDDWSFGARSPEPIEIRLDLDAALASLADGARAVFVLHLEGYSHEEIARMTGIAVGTARAQLWRARRALARLLEP